MRQSTKDSNWKILSRRVIYDRDTPTERYLERLTIFQTPWLSLKYHIIHKSDADSSLHSHPWSFRSLILRGTYREDTPDGPIMRKPGSVRKLSRDDLHRVEVLDGPVYTLVLVGKNHVDDWGFAVDGKIVPFAEYLGERDPSMVS